MTSVRHLRTRLNSDEVLPALYQVIPSGGSGMFENKEMES